jgi:hypothetical protein
MCTGLLWEHKSFVLFCVNEISTMGQSFEILTSGKSVICEPELILSCSLRDQTNHHAWWHSQGVMFSVRPYLAKRTCCLFSRHLYHEHASVHMFDHYSLVYVREIIMWKPTVIILQRHIFWERDRYSITHIEACYNHLRLREAQWSNERISLSRQTAYSTSCLITWANSTVVSIKG